VENLKGIIAKTRSAPRQLLLYKIIELVLPADEEALVALTKAKNEGLDTTVEGLITAIEGGGETAAAPPRSAAPAAAATLDLRKILHETVISRLHLSAYSPTDPINTLNQHLASRGLVIDMDVSRIPVRKYYDSMTGAPRFHISGEYRAPNMPQHWHTQLENARAEDVLNHVCRMYELGYKFVGNKVVITEPDDPGSVKTLGVQRRADDLVQEFQKEMARSTTQYRGQLVAVVGEVSGIGRSMSRDYVHLAGDKMRVVFDRDASETKLQELKDAYASLGERRYYIEFFGSATCKGLSTGRVVLTDCRDFYWRRLYRTTRN